MRKFTTLIALAVSWLAWSGYYDGLLLTFGALSCLFVFYLMHRIGLADLDPRSARTFANMVSYIPWLLLEIIKSNIEVAKIIWRPAMQLNPAVQDIPSTQETTLGLVTFANSVTLTPGTLTISAEPGSLKVHALNADAFEGDGFAEMDRRVSTLEQ
ncbi:MAG: Na+/H+ antiporter subunit E [Pseudomonadota bacterium]